MNLSNNVELGDAEKKGIQFEFKYVGDVPGPAKDAVQRAGKMWQEGLRDLPGFNLKDNVTVTIEIVWDASKLPPNSLAATQSNPPRR